MFSRRALGLLAAMLIAATLQADSTRSTALGDLNGDGRDDVLLRHREEGRWYYYPMNGRRYSSGRGLAEISRDLDREFAGIGDLNGDGRDDVLLRGRSDGRWYYYPMNGRRSLANQRGLANLTLNQDWQFAGIGDLNGDGRDDVLLRHREEGRWYYYPMNGRRYSSGRGLAEISRDLDREFAGIGDLNGDGRDDVLLRGRSDGRWYYYPMDGRRSLANQRGLANLTRNLDWSVAGIGDLNGDGRDDVLLRHANGRWHYYAMDGRRQVSSRSGRADLTPNTDWQFAGLGDLDGDGRDDVLVRHSNGAWHYYAMNGNRHIDSRSGRASLTRNLDWQPAGADNNGAAGGGGGTGDTGSGDPVGNDDHSDARSGATGLAPGGSVSGLIDPGNDVDYFIVEVSGSGTLTLYTTGSLDTQGALQNNSGVRQAFDDDGGTGFNFRIEHPVSSGAYYIEVGSYLSNTGNYTLHAEFIGASAPDLTVDTPTVSNRNPNAGDSFTLSTRVLNRGSGRSGSTNLRYYRSTDATINSSDAQVGTDSVAGLAASGSSSESIRLTAPSTAGTYYYGACVDSVDDESNTGNNCSTSVRVTVADNDGDDHGDTRAGATSLAVGGSATGRIDPGNDVDYFIVEVSGSGTLTLYTTGNLDTTGALQNSSGARQAFDDDGGTGTNFRIEHSVSSGAYYIEVGSYQSNTGSYTLHAEFRRSGDTGGGTGPTMPGGTTRDCADCPEMVSIPGGSFRMGDLDRSGFSNELPAHTVILRPFKLGKYEVTFAQWDACVAGGGCPRESDDRSDNNYHLANDEGWGRGNRPVINVSWDDAQLYIDWLNSRTGGGYRLPSEAEWEYAARAGSTTKYPWGNDIDGSEANCGHGCDNNTYVFTAPVGSFPANAWGLHDMLGNVWEWVQDCWHTSYRGAPNDGSAWTSSCDGYNYDKQNYDDEDSRRVMRGISWYGSSFPPPGISFRGRKERPQRSEDRGFRVAQDR